MRFAVFAFLIAFLIALTIPVSALDGWNYYRPITITNNVAQTLTDYQISFTLDTANLITQGKMRSDCGDLRVTLSDGQTLLPYWIASIKIIGNAVPTPTPPKPEGKSIKEIFEDLTLKTYNLPLEVLGLIVLLGIAVVGYGFGAFKGTVNLFFLSVLYYIAANALGWSTYIATGLLVVSAILLVIVVAFLKED